MRPIRGMGVGLVAVFWASAQTKVEPAKPVPSTAETGKWKVITDVPGIEVGRPERNNTGSMVILIRKWAVGGVEVRGSAPGSRETDLLRPTNMVDQVDAVILSGGGAYGLAAADGVMLWLEEIKIGWADGGGNVVPIVPSAILFDPGRFGRALGDRLNAEFDCKACEAAATGPVKMGNVGAGAVSGGLKGGLGTASVDLGNGVIVGAIVAINSRGSTVNPATGEFYTAFLEADDEFGSLKRPCAPASAGSAITLTEPLAMELVKNTTIAEMAHGGLARAIRPVHTMFDGDTMFALALAVVHAMRNAQTVGPAASYRDKFPGGFGK